MKRDKQTKESRAEGTRNIEESTNGDNDGEWGKTEGAGRVHSHDMLK